jgi:ribosomal protein S18 acetylase RimI-like enzyme
MPALIRVADVADTAGVTRLFVRIYESQHGPGSATAQGLLESTGAVLFPDQDGPTVLVYVIDDDIHGVVAYRLDQQHGSASIITVQAHDTVRGRSAAQLLLSETVGRCATAGALALVTDVPAADVRARGFLRREGFTPVVEHDVVAASQDDAVVTYQRMLSEDPIPASETTEG